MLHDYDRAADAVLRRKAELQQQLRQIRIRTGGRGNQRKQQELIRRILLLRDELTDLQDAIRSIRFYAAQEVQS